MHRFVLVFAILLPMFLVWCTEPVYQSIWFDGKSFVLQVIDAPYVQVPAKDLPQVYLGPGLKWGFVDERWVQDGMLSSGAIDFVSSILVAQQEVNEELDIDTFVQRNVEELYKYYPNISYDVAEEYFVCGSRAIPWRMVTFVQDVQDPEMELYRAQYYYIHQWIGTTVSHVSDSDKNRRHFKDAIKTFTCE